MTDKEVYDLLIRIDRGYIPSDIEIENFSKISRVKWETTDTIPESICLLKRLLVLDLSQSKITELPESIGNLTSLQSLDLSATQISELPEWIGSLTNLQSLDLSGTWISELPEWIDSLTSLQSLDLRGTRISKLPESIGSLTGLQSLDLGGTRISELPEWIGSLTSLQGLDLSSTRISELPEWISSLTSLQGLDLSSTRISELPEWIVSLTSLQSLELNRTLLSELPESFGSLTSLQGLDLSRTRISELPESFSSLTSLQSLDLNRTLLSELPEWIGSLTRLQGLDLSSTRISELPESFGSLTSLQGLYLSGTQISELPEWISSLTSLQGLDLSSTQISELPESFGSLTSLQGLDLSSTQISELPEWIGSLTSLQGLDLSSTQISELPDSFGSLTSLQSLDLNYTGISELPESFDSLTSLQSLNLSGTQISKLPKWISSLTSLQSLNLRGTQISKLPKWISSLTSLQSLYLSYTRISKLPKWISSLTSLQGLYLSGTRISELPESFGNLISLQGLDLSKNQISKLPEWIGSLTSLQSLDLSETRISKLPEWIGSLTSLQSLDLSETRISELPESFGSLTSLQRLDLSGTQISKLPKWISSLTSLQSLNLSFTRIMELPEWISSLTSLQSLDLRGTWISELPESFGSLTSLQSLDLSGTRLSELPKWISSLTSLQSLNLSFTRIMELPEWIGSLTSLQSLDLSGTRISELPEWISSLTSLQSLYLNKTRISELPESLLTFDFNFFNDYIGLKNGIYIKGLELQTQPISLFFQDRSLIKKYYASEKEQLKESKVIFMGDGGAGKSYTIQRIMNDGKNLDTDTDVTHDIAVVHWDNSNKIVEFNGSIDFWDFGGQDIYLSMHRCFMTDRSCYVIVLCNRQYGSHRGLMRQARYWLKNISDHAKDSPILLAVNTWRGQPRDGISLSQLKREFPELNIVDQIIYDAHDESNTEFNRLIDRICRMAQNHFSFSLQFPVSWNNIRIRLRQDYSKENYISEEEYYKICREELEKNDGYYDEGIAKWLLRWFNDLGYCFNYHDLDDKSDAEEYQVMKPQWVIRAMYKIINFKISHSPEPDRPAADTLAQSLADNWDPQEGVVPKKTIISLLTKKTGDEKPYTDQEAEYILRILQKYRLAYLIKRSRESLFIPALCSDIRPEDFDDTGSEKILKTEYVVRFKHLPETLMQHLLIACYQKGRIPDKVWQNGFHLYGDDEDQDLIITEVIGDTEISIKYYVSKEDRNFLSLHKVRSWLKDIYTELGIENVRDFIILRTEKQTAFISVKALINAYRDDPELDKFYVQDDDIYQAYSVGELLTGLYGHDYRTVLGISGKTVKEKDLLKSDTAAYSESYINIEISRDLKIIISQLREIADKKAPLDNETAAVLTNKITASIDHHNNDTITENVRLQELIKDLKEAQEENNKEKMQNLLSDSANSATILTALTTFARYAGTLL